MKQFLLFVAILLATNSLIIAQDRVVARNPDVIVGQLLRVTKPLSQMTDADKLDRKSTRLNSSHLRLSRMPSSA